MLEGIKGTGRPPTRPGRLSAVAARVGGSINIGIRGNQVLEKPGSVAGPVTTVGDLPDVRSTVPGEQGARRHDALYPKVPGQQPRQGGYHRPVSPVRLRVGDLAAQDRDLVPEHLDMPAGVGHVRAFANPVFDWSMSTYSAWLFGYTYGEIDISLYLCTGRDGWIESRYWVATYGDTRSGQGMNRGFFGGMTAVQSRRVRPDLADWGAAFLVVEATADAWAAAYSDAQVSTVAHQIVIDFF